MYDDDEDDSSSSTWSAVSEGGLSGYDAMEFRASVEGTRLHVIAEPSDSAEDKTGLGAVSDATTLSRGLAWRIREDASRPVRFVSLWNRLSADAEELLRMPLSSVRGMARSLAHAAAPVAEPPPGRVQWDGVSDWLALAGRGRPTWSYLREYTHLFSP